jgi:hypothetical protein
MAKCIYCGTDFERKRKDALYCKNACKTKAHREKHGLSEPEFLANKPNYLKVERSKDVIKRSVNPLYEAQQIHINHYDNEYKNLAAQKQKHIDKFTELSNIVPDNTHPIKYSLGVGNIVNSLTKNDFLTALSFMYSWATTHEKMMENHIHHNPNKLREIQSKIEEIDIQINNTLLYQSHHRELASQIPKHIETTETKTYFERIAQNTDGYIEYEAIDKNSSKIVNMEEFKAMNFEVLEMNYEYQNLIGNPPKGFAMLIYGESGNGKSTWAINFAEYLSKNFGEVLYNSSEEGFGETLKRKLNTDSKNLYVSDFRKFDELKNAIGSKYGFIFIDSVNDMDITAEQLRELREMNKNRSIIYLMQATKGGVYKGDSSFKHDSDFVIKLDRFTPVCEKKR